MRSTLYHALVVVACTLAVPWQILAGQQAMLLNLAIIRNNAQCTPPPRHVLPVLRYGPNPDPYPDL